MLLSKAQRQKWRRCELQGFRCHWCDKPVVIMAGGSVNRKIPNNAATDEHVYPRTDTRRYELGSEMRIRVVIACRKCNHDRGSMSYDDFLKLKRPEWRPHD